MNADEREATKSFLRTRGVTGPIRIAMPTGDDELVIVLSALEARLDTRIEQELQDLLHRKVWVVEDGPEWVSQTQEL